MAHPYLRADPKDNGLIDIQIVQSRRTPPVVVGTVSNGRFFAATELSAVTLSATDLKFIIEIMEEGV